MRIGVVAFALALLTLSQGAFAQSASHLRAAERLFDAMLLDKYLSTDPKLDSKRIPMLGEFLEQPEMKRQIAEVRARVEKGMPQIRAQVSKFLAERFTERELGELRRQFRSPAGAKFAQQKFAVDWEIAMAFIEQAFLEMPEIKKALQEQREAAAKRSAEFGTLLARADGGEAAAQQQLSVRYCSGSYPDAKGKVDQEKCDRYRLLAAEGGDATAQFTLAQQFLLPGPGGARDPKKGLEWMRKAADGGHASAKLATGRLMLGYATGDAGMRPSGMPEIVDAGEGEKILRSLAEAGNATAQMTLADAYLTGTGVAKNPAEGASMLRLAADKGNRIAMQRLGDLYFSGDGLPRNADESLRWYRLSLGKK